MSRFGTKFQRLILIAENGSSYAVELTGLEGHSINIGRSGNRTQLEITLKADMGVVRYQPSDALRLAAPGVTMTLEEKLDYCWKNKIPYGISSEPDGPGRFVVLEFPTDIPDHMRKLLTDGTS
jgi:hypothetical protein